MEDNWWSDKAEKLQAFADAGDTRGFYQPPKIVYRLKGTQSNPVLATSGPTLLTERSETLETWEVNFNQLLNHTNNAGDSIIKRIPPWSILHGADDKLRLDEVEAVKEILARKKSLELDVIRLKSTRKNIFCRVSLVCCLLSALTEKNTPGLQRCYSYSHL